jgi:hypothetical protein
MHGAAMATGVFSKNCERRSKTWSGRCSIFVLKGYDLQCKNWESAFGLNIYIGVLIMEHLLVLFTCFLMSSI